jgi:hypothetical protein
MRRFLLFASLLFSATVWAQPAPKLDPLPEPPPLPPGVAVEAPGDAAIRISPGLNDKIEEITVEGKRAVRVTTPSGLVYYIKEDPASPRGGTIDPPMRVPLWLIHSF